MSEEPPTSAANPVQQALLPVGGPPESGTGNSVSSSLPLSPMLATSIADESGSDRVIMLDEIVVKQLLDPIPSALFLFRIKLLVATEKTDMNAPVQPGDTQVSFTQFTSGGLFHHVDNSYWTEGELADTDPAEYARLMEKKQLQREEGLQIYSTVDEFANTE
ncbi:hypothetical protein B0H14DRAFT_3858815 [Mycena olivaceomarginata]|nr:hypothetical protein B0H14DRAFT_3858815 [Mycena olivaceomarginata]